MKEYKCMDCLTSFESEYKEDCPSCGDDSDVIEVSANTDKLSVEKLEPIGYYNEAHGFLHDEFDKDCYCQGGCSMEAVYTESQVKKLTGENKVEKLQEIRVEELKDFNSKILQAELKNQKLQKQLNTAKYFFKNILDVDPNLNKGHVSHLENCVRVMKNSAEKALAAIGGDDEL